MAGLAWGHPTWKRQTMLLNIRGDETSGTRFDQLVRQLVRNKNGACWSGFSINSKGYATLYIAPGRTAKAVTLAYELRYGPVPKGLELDHLCRNRWCWNPDHVEPVTRSVNQLRGKKGEEKTHCPQGHPYSEENTLMHLNNNGRYRKQCRLCRRRQRRSLYERTGR